MLELSHVSMELRGRPVLRDISLTLTPGSFTAVIGPNGAGKSTILRLMSGEIHPTAGAITLDGRPLRDLGARELATRRAVVPQASSLAFPFTAREVVALGTSVPGLAAPGDDTALDRALEMAGIAHLQARFYTELSGGERQRVQVARALCQLLGSRQPPSETLLLLDEPTSSLDFPHQGHVMRIARAQARLGRLVVAVLHDINLAATWVDSILALRDGEVCAFGPPAEILTEDLLLRLYGLKLRLTSVPGSDVPALLPQSADRAARLTT